MKIPAGLWYHRAMGCMVIALVCCCIGTAASAQTWYRQSGGTVSQASMVYTATHNDTVGVYVYNNGTFTLSNSRIRKTGNTSNTDSSSFYGRNAAVLAKTGVITLINDSITANGIGVNGAFACNPGSLVTLSYDTIACSGDYSHGVEATVGATLTAANCIINTTGSIGASAIATDCGGGTIHIYDCSVHTQQIMAAGIYSTGTITAEGTSIVALAENACVIDGRNSISITNCTLDAALNAIKIYESHPGDTAGTAHFVIDGGTLTSAGHSVYIGGNHGTRASVLVKNSAALLPASGYIVRTDSGASLAFVADAVTLTGDIYADSAASGVDTINTALQNGTTLAGIITRSALSLDNTSSWNVTGDSYITTLTNADGVDTSLLTVSNITGNGHNVYYKATLPGNSWLGGKNYALVSGGCLLPVGGTCSATTLGKDVVVKQVSVYPNPAGDALTLGYPATWQGAVATISSADGKLVGRYPLAAGTNMDIDISTLNPGVYFLSVAHAGEKKVMKFIKQ